MNTYAWIDNDGRCSAEQVIAELQDLALGDQILMTPAPAAKG